MENNQKDGEVILGDGKKAPELKSAKKNKWCDTCTLVSIILGIIAVVVLCYFLDQRDLRTMELNDKVLNDTISQFTAYIKVLEKPYSNKKYVASILGHMKEYSRSRGYELQIQPKSTTKISFGLRVDRTKWHVALLTQINSAAFSCAMHVLDLRGAYPTVTVKNMVSVLSNASGPAFARELFENGNACLRSAFEITETPISIVTDSEWTAPEDEPRDEL